MSCIHYKIRNRRLTSLAVVLFSHPQMALGHASEQGFVLLLPTDVYMTAGVACVVLTIVLLTLFPERSLARIYAPIRLWRLPQLSRLRILSSLASFAILMALLWSGLVGPRDPLTNPLPLFVWTGFWIGLVTVQGAVADLWRWINPWTGPVAVTRRALGLRPFLRLPSRFGHAFAILTFGGFAILLLADPAPSDPARLAGFVGAYWLLTYLALLGFGPRWSWRGDGISLMMRCYAGLALFGRSGGRAAAGLTGWRALRGRTPGLGVAVFILILLGSGSFDGLNETFWWLDLIGINPLEFPGRSAVIAQNISGLLVANAALIMGFAFAIWLGLALVRSAVGLRHGFCLFAPSILPIALGYHVAHYLTSFLVDGQYALAALNDPLARGDDLLGLGTFYVTTGFFNTPGSVRVIWLTQAGAVVLGHVLAVMMAHRLALRAFADNRTAALSLLPLSVFMVFYTLFGLWLLASPRGL